VGKVSGSVRRYDARVAQTPRKKAPAAASTQAEPLDPGLRWIERMRVYRGRTDRDLSVAGQLAGIERGFRERNRALGDVIDAWNDLAPGPLRNASTIAGLAQGTLTIEATGSSAGYELSRALRGGLEQAMTTRLTGRVRRIRVRVGGAGG
jgi:hypothetical protein